VAELRVISVSDTLSHVALRGRLDIEGVEKLEIPFTAATVSGRKPTLVDMSGVEFLGSMGIGLLVRCAVSLQRQGARLALFGCQPMVRKSLETSRVTAVIPVADTEAAALVLLASG
jgi:anti-anti-sigma factor